MTRSLRFATSALLGAGALVLLAQPAATADSDLFGNVGPESQVPQGGLAARYPLSHYALDQHFTAVEASLTGGVDVSGVPALIAYFLANLLWELTAFIANAVITLFTFAFSLDLVQGSEATGGAGALAPVSDAVRTIYREVFGQAWLVVSITLAGVWAMWRALVQRRYTETAGALGLSLVFVVIALAFVTQPERTIGSASDWTNRMSAAFLSLTSEGDIGSEDQAKRSASDQLFELLIYDPWTVLNFGGIEHCVKPGTGDEDSDPESLPVRPLAQNPARDRQLRAQLRAGAQVQADGKTCINNRNKYAPHFLAFSPASDPRDAEYEALNTGDTDELPDEDPAKDDGSYELGVADKPATDAMEEGGQYQRLLMAVVIFIAELGAFLLLGALSVAVILAQVLVLLLLAFAPVALVVGVFPGRGHDFFKGWLTRLGAFLLRKAIYSLILAVLLAVAAALAEASAYLGWFMAFGLQALFFWAVFLYRNELTGKLTAATTGVTGHDGADAGQRLRSLYYTSQLAKLARPGRRDGGRPPRPPGGTPPEPPAPPDDATPPPPGGAPPPPAPDGDGATARDAASPDDQTEAGRGDPRAGDAHGGDDPHEPTPALPSTGRDLADKSAPGDREPSHREGRDADARVGAEQRSADHAAVPDEGRTAASSSERPDGASVPATRPGQTGRAAGPAERDAARADPAGEATPPGNPVAKSLHEDGERLRAGQRGPASADRGDEA